MQLICLIGLAQSGKSTTAVKIVDILNRNGKRGCIKSLATPLKALATKRFEYDEAQKNNGHRTILEELAFDIKEVLGQYVFAYTLLDDIQDVCCDYDYIIIDDLRYKEELQVLSEFFPVDIVHVLATSYQTLKYDKDRLDALMEYIKEYGYDYKHLVNPTEKNIKSLLFTDYDEEE